MFKAFKYRIYPNKSQEELIVKHIDSSRFVYNLALETKNSAFSGSKHSFSAFDLIRQLPDLKEQCPWLKEINSQSLQQSIRNLDTAFKSFFSGGGFPKFKSKTRSKQSFSILQGISVKSNLLIIPKFKKGIKLVYHRPIEGTIKSATITVTKTGKYFVSILCDTGETTFSKPSVVKNTTVGVDLGIKNFAITSEGEVFENPKFLRKAQNKLKYVHRKYSKHSGKRTKQKLALLYEKITNKRKDFLHKVSTKLIRENQTIAIETLVVKNMIKNHKLAQSIGDSSWSTFVSMLVYKAEWYGANILRIGQFAPSSKTCSVCGTINKELLLKDREWSCNNCFTVLDRDINAAVNIKAFALKNHLSVEHTLKNQGELPTIVGALTLETP